MKKNQSTINTEGYIVYSTLFFCLLYLFYFYSVFSPYVTRLRFSSVKEFNFITIFSFASCFIAFSRTRHIVTMITAVVFPFCIFTLINLRSLFQGLTSMAILMIASMAAVCFIIIRKDYSMSSGKGFRFSNRTLKKCVIAVQMVFTLIMSLCIMTVVVTNVIVFHKNSSTDVSMEEQQAMEEVRTYDLSVYTTDNFSKELESFNAKNWSELTMSERLQLLQLIANIEANSMGIAQPFVVKSDNLVQKDKDIYTTGCYQSKYNTIYIDNYYLEAEESYWVLQTICHECYHGWQHSLVKLYFEAGEDCKQLRIFSDVREYIDNMKSYDEALQNFDQYYNLKLESMARSYGEDRAKDYYLLSLRINPANKDHFDFPEDKDRKFKFDVDYDEESCDKS